MDRCCDQVVPASKRPRLCQEGRFQAWHESWCARVAFRKWTDHVSLVSKVRIIQKRWLHKLLQPVIEHDQGYQNAMTRYYLTRGPLTRTLTHYAAPPTFQTWREPYAGEARVLNAHPLFNPACNGALCYAQLAADAVGDPVPSQATAGDLRALLDEMHVTINQPEYAELLWGGCCIRMVRCYLMELPVLSGAGNGDRHTAVQAAQAAVQAAAQAAQAAVQAGQAAMLGMETLTAGWSSKVLPWNAYPVRYTRSVQLLTVARQFGYDQRDRAGRYFKNVRRFPLSMASRDRAVSGVRLHGLSSRHRPGGVRCQNLNYVGHGGPVRAPVSYDEEGNPD